MKINKRIINEDTLEGAVNRAAKAINGEEGIITPDATKDDVFDILDEALETAREIQFYNEDEEDELPDIDGLQNVLLIGGAGTGKTARVKAWAKSRGVHILGEDAKTLDETDLGGIPARNLDPGDDEDPKAKKARDTLIKLATTELDALDNPDTILFLDEFNRAPANIRGTLLEVVNNHVVNDPRTPSHKRFLKGFLFTIAAINPPNAAYNTDTIDLAELSRFRMWNVIADPQQHLSFLNKFLDSKLAKAEQKGNDALVTKLKGRKGIANALLKSPSFKFDDDEEEAEQHEAQAPILNPRSLTNLLMSCNGTKDDFLKKWSGFCNPNKQITAENILSKYTDIDDKANDALKKYGPNAESGFAKKEKTIADILDIDNL